ncbi:hypothetical protein CCACVL1_06630 [Corchorus capsularis]|uniref:Uncharacterized protein n=1 Tax=Corchorus capsularis TaxID=210143 RepID=A0A1R3JE61_COCAP|nr:hypothetical protein CCACVL1_06630 [Corchorus capsularis]
MVVSMDGPRQIPKRGRALPSNSRKRDCLAPQRETAYAPQEGLPCSPRGTVCSPRGTAYAPQEGLFAPQEGLPMLPKRDYLTPHRGTPSDVMLVPSSFHEVCLSERVCSSIILSRAPSSAEHHHAKILHLANFHDARHHFEIVGAIRSNDHQSTFTKHLSSVLCLEHHWIIISSRHSHLTILYSSDAPSERMAT